MEEKFMKMEEKFISVKSDISSALWSLGYKIQTIPETIEVGVKSETAYRRLKKAANEKKKEEMKKALIYSGVEDCLSDNMSKKIAEYCAQDSTPIRCTLMATKANKTREWIQYVQYYMTNQDSKLISADKLERELCNAIAALFNFSKIFENSDTAYIDTYDISSPHFKGVDAEFILDVEEIRQWGSTDVMNVIAIRKEQLIIDSNFSEEEKEKRLQEMREHEKKQQEEEIQRVNDIFGWNPFSYTKFIGYRVISLQYNVRIYCQFIEMISNDMTSYCLFNDKTIYHNLKDTVGMAVRTIEDMKLVQQSHYLPISVNEADMALQRILPRFSDVCCKLKDTSITIINVNEAIRKKFAIDNSNKSIKLLSEKDVSLLSDKVVSDLNDIYKYWETTNYAQVFGKELSDFWKEKLQELSSIIQREKNKREESEAKAQDQLKVDAIKQAGEKGEIDVEFQLKWLPEEYIVVSRDNKGITLLVDDMHHEIDHIVITPQGVFLIETKAMAGKIKIDEHGNWTQEKNNTEEGIKNPIEQIHRHHYVLEKILGIKNIYDVICIANSRTILEGVDNCKIPVVKSDMLLQFFKEHEADGGVAYSVEECKDIEKTIEKYRVS